jgi:hypothetical protein
MVADGKLPPGIRVDGIVMWDRLDLDSAVDDWKSESEDEFYKAMAAFDTKNPEKRTKRRPT